MSHAPEPDVLIRAQGEGRREVGHKNSAVACFVARSEASCNYHSPFERRERERRGRSTSGDLARRGLPSPIAEIKPAPTIDNAQKEQSVFLHALEEVVGLQWENQDSSVQYVLHNLVRSLEHRRYFP